MSHRFYRADPILFDPQRECVVRLSGDEAHHAVRVMRLAAGDELTLFDGTGWEFAAEVRSAKKSEVELLVSSAAEVDREPSVELTLGVAMPKGDRQKVLVEKLTELGVRRLVPLVTERGVAQPKAAGVEKLRRVVIEASKQCRRNRLMQIEEPTPFAKFLKESNAHCRCLAHPPNEPLPATAPQPPTAAAGSPPNSIAIAIGPEGGFTDEEVAAAVSAGWQPKALGKSILRIETAAIAAAAIYTAATEPIGS